MTEKQNPPELLTICAVLIVLSILGIVGGLSRELFGSMDGLLMLAICLVMALLFTLLLFVLAKEQGWLGKHGPNGGPSAATGSGK